MMGVEQASVRPPVCLYVRMCVNILKHEYLRNQWPRADCNKYNCSLIRIRNKLHEVLGQIGLELRFPWQQIAPIEL